MNATLSFRPAPHRPAPRRTAAHRTVADRTLTHRALTHRTATRRTPVHRVGVARPAVRRPVGEAAYRRRRRVLGLVAAAVFAIGVVATHDVLAGPGGVAASAAPDQPALVRPTVVALPGDSLWSIAAAHHGSISITRYVDKLVDLNGGPSIQAGQSVVLP